MWLLFATNAMNFIDGLNGLAGGVALIAACFLAGIAAAHDGWFAYFAALLLIAGLAGFLPFNFPPRVSSWAMLAASSVASCWPFSEWWRAASRAWSCPS